MTIEGTRIEDASAEDLIHCKNYLEMYTKLTQEEEEERFDLILYHKTCGFKASKQFRAEARDQTCQ
jgi:hypothetical protein